MSATIFIENLLDQAALSVNERRELWNRYKSQLAPVVEAFQKIDATISFPDSLDVSIAGDKHKLAEAIRVLRTRGFTTDQPGPHKGDSTWHAFFKSPDCEVSIWFAFSSTVCRRVKTGTKTMEVDVYETVCDEITLPDESAA
jgi:hypothetical protein